MHSPKVLELRGGTPERLREIFTATSASKPVNGGPDVGNSPGEALTTAGTKLVPNPTATDAPINEGSATPAEPKGKSNWEIRKRFEEEVRSRVLSGIAIGINNARPLQAVDMAWDAPPIQKETVPLLLWAQGKIKMEGVCDFLSNQCDPTTAAKFLKKNTDGKMIVSIPRICDFSINLVRSYVTRRHAAMAALWDNLWPLLRYDPRGTDEVASLTGDALTQRVDIMADEYNYRHFLSQCDRDKLLYAQSLIFPRSAWDKKQSWRLQKSNLPGAAKEKLESYVTQEGVDCVNPHPSRWLYDLGAPLANVNTNNGPTYIGYWDIIRYGTIRDGNYFNIESIAASEAWWQLLQQQSWYFNQYFDPCVIQQPTMTMGQDPALGNDRAANIGFYTAEMKDKGVLLTQYFRLINPKQEGICDYDADIWLRLSAAGDGTIVAAEFMPSIPACYGGINVNDNRVANASLAMEMLPYQDMCSNIVSQMIQQLRISFMMLVMLDEDSLDPDVVKDLKSSAKNMEWWMDPKFLTYSATKLKELGVMDPSQAFKIIQAEVVGTVENSIRAIGQVLALADRLVNSSPNELGQPNPREVSARETQEISTTIQSVYAFYNEGPREQRAAFKRMIYESLMCYGSETFEVPVLKRYRKSTIEAAGFEAPAMKDKAKSDLAPAMTRITGKLCDLEFAYYFDSRDGAERPLNTQGAQVLQQLFAGLIQIPGVAQKIGMKRMFGMLNTIARMAGAPDEFQFELDDGEDEGLPGEEGAPEMSPEIKQAIEKIMAELQAMAVNDAGMQQFAAEVSRRLNIAAPQGSAPAAPAPSGAPAPVTAGTPAGPGASQANGASILQQPTAA